MGRVTSAEVKEIIETDLDSTGLAPFILGANLTVTERLGDSGVLSAEQLKEIERWYTAHLISMSNKDQGARDVDREKTLDAEVTYAGKTGKGLEATRFGQTVIALDTTGKMAASGKGTVFFKAVTSFD